MTAATATSTDAGEGPPTSHRERGAALPHARNEPAGLFASSNLHQAMGAYLPATVAVRLINFARVLLLSWWMIPQQFGLLSMILLTIQVLTPLCSLGLCEAVTRYVPRHEAQGTLRRFLEQTISLVVAFTGAATVLMVLFATPLGELFYAYADVREQFRRDAGQLARVTAVVTANVVLYYYVLAIFKGLRMFRAIAWMETLHAVLFLAAGGFAVATRHLSALTITALYGLCLAIPLLVFGLAFIRAVKRWTGQHQRPALAPSSAALLRFSLWATLAGIVWQAMMYYPAWYLNKTSGHDAVAVFSAVRQIGQFVLIGAMAIVTVVMTTVTRSWESRGREAAHRQLSLAFRGVGLGLLLFCALVALAKKGVILLFRPEYAPGAAILPLHLLFFLIAAYLAFLPIHFHLIEKARHMFWPWALGVAANVLYAFWLTGERADRLCELPLWKLASSILSPLAATGLRDPQGLCGAAWCGVLAIGTALMACVVLVRAECSRLDRGTYIVIAAAGLLMLNSLLLAAGVVLLIAAAWRTEWIFSREERERLLRYALRISAHASPPGQVEQPRAGS